MDGWLLHANLFRLLESVKQFNALLHMFKLRSMRILMCAVSLMISPTDIHSGQRQLSCMLCVDQHLYFECLSHAWSVSFAHIKRRQRDFLTNSLKRKQESSFTIQFRFG